MFRRSFRKWDWSQESAELQRIPNEALDLSMGQAIQNMKIIEEFEDDDDVQAVSHSLNVTDEVSEAINE